MTHLQSLAGWSWSWAAADRRGRLAFLADARSWSAVIWCSLLVNGDEEPHIDAGVQLFARVAHDVKGTEFQRIKRALAKLVAPAGYRVIHFRPRTESPTTFLVEKRVHTLALARKERARLDKLIVGE
jgi:hypothetical protein